MPDWIEPGSKAPAFTLKDDANNKVKLSDLKGNPVVIYFYPRDDTPGCTKEACAFRDRYDEIKKRGVRLFGVSDDDAASTAAVAVTEDPLFARLVATDSEITTAKCGPQVDK